MLAAAAMVAVTARAIFRAHVVLPVWDEWVWVGDLQRIREGSYGWADLLRPHNEHRIALPRLVFLADARLFAMGGYAVLAVNMLLQAASAALLIRLMARSVADAAARALLASLVVAVLFSLRQGANLGHVFQVQFVGVSTAALLAISAYVDALTRRGAGERGAVPSFGIAAAACVAAAYTMANGVLTGLVLVVLALLMRAPWRTIAATLALWCALAAAFLHGYDAALPAQPQPQALLPSLLLSLDFLLAYLGNPVSAAPPGAEMFGALGLVAFTGAAWCVATRRTPAPGAAALLGIAGFMVATGCSTDYGRAALGIEQAFELRYTTPPALFWCALVLFWAPILGRVPLGRGALAGRALLAVAVAALVAGSIRFEVAAPPEMAAQAAVFRQFRDSLLTGLYDADVTARYENWYDGEIRRSADFLRAARLSLFAGSRAGFLGRRLAEVGTVTAPRLCDGSVGAARAAPDLGRDGVRLRGFAFDRAHGRDARDILLTDRDGVVVGYGSEDRPLGLPREWTGYARSPAGSDVEAYAEIDAGRFCRLGAMAVGAR